jgi:hypothetical protein
LPPSMERLWLGELRRARATINIIIITASSDSKYSSQYARPGVAGTGRRLQGVVGNKKPSR